MAKKKILMLSDHALSTSGVGCQSRYLIDGLIKKGSWSVRQFGAAIKHSNYNIVKISDDFIIKPVDGFGTPDLLRQTLAVERPDVLLLFTDPRFFIWVWEMEDEIHQICPIAYWHVWDNLPVPKFNQVLYDSTDLINCHSHATYSYVKDMAPGRTNFIPHALPPDLFKPIESKEEIKSLRDQIIGKDRSDHFVLFWVNRNAKRKRPNDILWAWQLFTQKVQEKHGKKNVTLLMHTQPDDQEGPNLYATTEMMEIQDSVVFSPERIDFTKMNMLHNISDACINISYAEGFGLATLEAMQCGKPIIALKTGGLTRQVVDHRDGTENGVALPVEMQSLVGSQQVPYIYEDYCSAETTANAILKLYEMSPEEREALGQKARNYALSEFSLQSTVDQWDRTLTDLTENWKSVSSKWSIKEM
ncbi:MAG: glycosyltransferase [Proteobacteria bacterium]|nr:glycosyltransferase [Pseudomonadota bacterium]